MKNRGVTRPAGVESPLLHTAMTAATEALLATASAWNTLC